MFEVKNVFVVVLSDEDPVQFKDVLNYLGLDKDDPVILCDNRPNFFDILKIDSMDIKDTEWKHVVNANLLPDESLEILDYVTSFGRTISNF